MQWEGKFYSIFIVGLGLIGGSISLSLKGKWIRYGFDVSKEVEEKAVERGVVDGILPIKEGFKKDIVLISIPSDRIPYFIRENKKFLSPSTILMDTGSTKRKIVDEMRKVDSFFIGGHPIAGKEKGGIDSIDENLFKGKIFVLTEENNLNQEKKRLVYKLIHDIGSEYIFMSAERHDFVFGLVSHLPYLISLSLFYYIIKKDKEAVKFAGSGLRDTTRIASGDPLMSYGMVRTNLDNLKLFIPEYISLLKYILKMVEDESFIDVAEFVKGRRDEIW